MATLDKVLEVSKDDVMVVLLVVDSLACEWANWFEEIRSIAKMRRIMPLEVCQWDSR